MDSTVKTVSRPEAGPPHLFPSFAGPAGQASPSQPAVLAFRPSFLDADRSGRFDAMSLPGAGGSDGEPESIDIAALEAAAFQRGCEQGRLEGLDAGRREVAPVIKQLRQVMGDLQAAWRQLQGQAEHDAVGLALAVARKILGREPSVTPEQVLDVVKAAVAKVSDQDRILIRIDPADIEVVRTHDETIDAWVEKAGAVTIEADNSVGPGGCVIETDFGDVDARLEKQLEVIEAAFKAQLGMARR